MLREIFRRKAKLNLIAALIVVMIFALSLPANAATGFYFNGGWKTVSNNGAAITIETQNPSVATDSWISAWPMTADGSDGYAQVGWWKVSGYTGPKYFYEYNYGSTWYQKELGSATVGSHNNFKVGNDSTTMYFIINDVTYGTVALSTIPFTRSMVQFFGETHNTSDQCPGSVSNPVTMGSAQYKNTSNTWVTAVAVNPNAQGQGDLTTMKNNISSNGSSTWEIWDSRY